MQPSRQPVNGEMWGIADAAAVIAEVDRELGEREALDRELVRKGRLDESEAAYLRKLLADIRADLAEGFGPITPGEPCFWPREDRAVAWANKVRWVNSELDARRSDYPELVRKGRLIPEDAQRRISALELLRTLYWEKMFMWEPPAGPALEYRKAMRAAVMSRASAEVRDALWTSEGGKIYREYVRSHAQQIELEQAGQGRLVA